MDGNGKHLLAQLEAARGLLRDMRHAATINPSCQFGMVNPCRCMFCVETRVNAFLTATPAPEVQAEQGERQEAVPEARRQVLLMTSYCADEGASCTDDSPCADCLSMCNVVVISGGRLEHVGQLDNLPGFNKLVLEETSLDMLRLVKALEHYAGCGKSGNVARVALAAHRQAQRQA